MNEEDYLKKETLMSIRKQLTGYCTFVSNCNEARVEGLEELGESIEKQLADYINKWYPD
jgi:hypothetical protein